MQKILSLLILLSVSLFSFDINDNVSIRGFATLDATMSTDDTTRARLLNGTAYKLEENKPSYKYSSFGLQLDSRFNDSFSFMAQTIYSKESLTENYEVSLDWLMLIYDLGNDYQLRLGAMKVPFMQATETRNINYTFLWTRPLLASKGVNGFNDMQGFDLRKKTYIDEVDIELQFTYGKAEHDTDVDKNEYIWNVSSLLSYEESWLRLSYGQMRFNHYTERGIELNKNAMLTSISTETKLTYENVSLYAGIAKNTNDAIPDLSYKYISLAYDFDLIRPYLLYNESKVTNIPVIVLGPLGLPRPVINKGYSLERNYSIGSRYDIYENVALKFQYNYRENETQSIAKTSNDVYTITLDLVF